MNSTPQTYGMSSSGTIKRIARVFEEQEGKYDEEPIVKYILDKNFPELKNIGKPDPRELEGPNKNRFKQGQVNSTVSRTHTFHIADLVLILSTPSIVSRKMP